MGRCKHCGTLRLGSAVTCVNCGELYEDDPAFLLSTLSTPSTPATSVQARFDANPAATSSNAALIAPAANVMPASYSSPAPAANVMPASYSSPAPAPKPIAQAAFYDEPAVEHEPEHQSSPGVPAATTPATSGFVGGDGSDTAADGSGSGGGGRGCKYQWQWAGDQVPGSGAQDVWVPYDEDLCVREDTVT